MSNRETERVDAMAFYHRLWTRETELIRSIQQKLSAIDSFEGQFEFAAGAMEMADRLAELREKPDLALTSRGLPPMQPFLPLPAFINHPGLYT